jgi:putative glycerol-1-phosphate prenyltransferase
MQVGVYQKMVEDKKQRKKSFAVLIDPDKVNEKKLDELAQLAIDAQVDYFFLGTLVSE